MYEDSKEHWRIEDTLIKASGEVEEEVMYNQVVDGLGRVIGALMKGQAGYNNTLYMAVGSGNASWDSTGAPPVDKSTSSLTAEFYRKLVAPADVVFVDSNNNVTASVTNRVRINVSFLDGQANGAIREFALFGGNATATLGSGIMINRKNHGLKQKETGDILNRSVIINL